MAQADMDMDFCPVQRHTAGWSWDTEKATPMDLTRRGTGPLRSRDVKAGMIGIRADAHWREVYRTLTVASHNGRVDGRIGDYLMALKVGYDRGRIMWRTRDIIDDMKAADLSTLIAKGVNAMTQGREPIDWTIRHIASLPGAY